MEMQGFRASAPQKGPFSGPERGVCAPGGGAAARGVSAMTGVPAGSQDRGGATERAPGAGEARAWPMKSAR
jgi:hypothetical protein